MFRVTGTYKGFGLWWGRSDGVTVGEELRAEVKNGKQWEKKTKIIKIKCEAVVRSEFFPLNQIVHLNDETGYDFIISRIL